MAQGHSRKARAKRCEASRGKIKDLLVAPAVWDDAWVEAAKGGGAGGDA